MTSEQDEVRQSSGAVAVAHRALIATLVVTGVVIVLSIIWYAADLLLIVFAGILVSIFLRGCTGLLSQKTGFGHGLSLALVLLAILIFIVLGAWLFTARIGAQLGELQRQLPQAVDSLSRNLEQYGGMRSAIDSLPSFSDWFAKRSSTIVPRLTGLASTTLGAIVNVLLAGTIGLYLASQPELYSRGIIRLVPPALRERAGEVMSVVDHALWRWLGGRFCLMLLNGGLTAVGLWILDVPLALSLGLLAGLLNFIPIIGPWIAAIPAVLIGFLQGPQEALYVASLYLLLQSIDGYLFTPLVDRKSVKLAPVLTISAQVLMGVTFGFIGILLASPLTATVMILVNMLYIEDLLGGRVTPKCDEAESAKPDRDQSEDKDDA